MQDYINESVAMNSANKMREGDDSDESGVTFNLSNLNYIKKRLFGPELDYLSKKFDEKYASLVGDLKDSFRKELDRNSKQASE